MKTHLCLYLLITLLFLFAGSIFLQAADNEIKVGIYQNDPKIYMDKSGHARGIFVELLDEIARQENWIIVYVSFPWEEALAAVEDGRIDLLPDVAFTPERSKTLDFSTLPILHSWSQIYSHPRWEILRLSDLDKKRITFLKGSVQEESLEQLMAGYLYTFTAIPAESYEMAFQLVKEGQADAVMTNRLYGETHARDYKLKKTLIIFNPSSLYFATKKGTHEQLLATIDAYLRDWMLHPHSIYYSTMAPYYDRDPEGKDRSLLLIVIFSILLVLLAAFVLILLLRRQLRGHKENIRASYRLLNNEKQKFENYIEFSPYGVFLADRVGKYIDVNSMACRITGYEHNELIGKNILGLVSEQEYKSVVKHLEKALRGENASGIFQAVTKQGTTQYLQVDTVKIDPDYLLSFISDISDKEESLKRLRRLSQIFEVSLNEIYVCDAKTLQFMEVNYAACTNTGYTYKELMSMTPLDLNLDINVKDFRELIKPLENHEKDMVVFTTKCYRKDSSSYDIEVHLQLFEYKNETLFTAIILDISERLKSEATLKELTDNLEHEVERKTAQLKERVAELEHFRDITIEREIRMKEISEELKALKEKTT